MKVAPMIFCASLAIFLTTVAVSKRTPIEISKTTQVLDFKGIDTLEIRSTYTAKISIRDDAVTTLSYDMGYDYDNNENNASRFSVKISGSKMLVSTDIASYRDFTIVVPSSVKKLLVQNANINTNAGTENLAVHVSKSLQWEGNANSVQITDMRDYSDPEKGCTSNIEIKSGAISDLFIETSRGMVKLDALDQIKATTLQVGPKASLSISPISSMKRIQFREDSYDCLDI
jgi:hypothetical protein